MTDVQNTNVFLKQLPNGYTQVLPTGSYRTDGLAYAIQPGTKTDVSLLGSGSYGKIYLPGDLKEYTRTVAGSTIRLTRTVDGKLEEIITNANASTPQGHTLQFGDRALNLKELKSYTNDPTFRENLDRSTEFRKEKQISNLMGQLAQYIDPSSSGEAWSVLGSEQMINQLQDKLSAMLGGLDLSKVGEKTVPVYEKVIITPVYEVDSGNVRYVAQASSDNYLTPTAQDLQNMVPVGEGYNVANQLVPTYEANIKTRDVKRLYNKDTGEIIEGSPIGQGMFGGPSNYPLADWNFKDVTYAGLSFDANGNPVIRTADKSSSDLDEILPALAILTLPFTLGGGLAALGGGEAALLAAESGIALGGAGIAGLEAGALAGLGTAGAAELGGLAALGEGAGAAASVGGAEAGLGSLASNLTVGEVASVISNPTSLITKPLTESITNQIVSQLGLSGAEVTVAKTAVASVINAGTAELLGGDPAKAALATVGGTAFNAVAGPIIGDIAENVTDSVISALDIDLSTKAFDSITRGVTNSISTGVTTALAGGDAQDVLINSGVAFIGGALAKEKIPGTKFDETDLGELIPGYFDRLEVTATAECPPGQIDTGFGCEPIVTKTIVAEPPVGPPEPPVGPPEPPVGPPEPPVGPPEPPVGPPEPPVGPPEPPTDRLEVTATAECPPGQIDTGFGCEPIVTKTIVAEPPVGPPEPPVGPPEPPVQVKATRESCAVDGLGFDETLEQCVEITKPTDRLEVRATAECPPGQVDTGFGCEPIVTKTIVAEPPVQVKATRESCAVDGLGFDETLEQCVEITKPTDRLEVRATAECPPGQVDTGFGCEPIVTKTIVAEPPVVAEPPATTECAPGFHDVNGLCVADDDRSEETECQEGKVRNLNTGLCETPKATTCPNGYVLNPTTGQCEVKVGLLALPGAFSSLFRNANSGGGAGYSPNIREKFMATRTYTPPPKDYDYFTDPYFQRFGPISYVPLENYAGAGKAEGGLMSLAKGGRTSLPPRYLNGHSDGMADKVPASIDNSRPAALSDGEFVIPADVVSHLGNGNSNAGAKVLYAMMDRIRRARTGNSKQGKQINPSKFIPR